MKQTLINTAIQKKLKMSKKNTYFFLAGLSIVGFVPAIVYMAIDQAYNDKKPALAPLALGTAIFFIILIIFSLLYS